MHTVELGAVLTLGLMLRLLAIARPNSDQWRVRGYIERQRPRRWISFEVPDSVLPGTRPYPQLVHYLASRFPAPLSTLAAFAMTVLPDVVIAGGVYAAIILELQSLQGISSQAGHEFGLAGSILFLTLPGLVPGESRMCATNGRAFGLLFATAYFCCVAAALQGSPLFWLPIATAIAMLVFLTSQFGMQTVVFFSLLLALFHRDAVPLVPVVATIGIGFLLPSIGIRDIVIGKLNHFIWYNRNREGTLPAARKALPNVVAFFRALRSDPGRAKKLFLTDSPIIIAVYSIPPLWVLLAATARFGSHELASVSPTTHFSMMMVLASGCLFVLTCHERLSIFGQAERYFEYAAPMICVCLAVVGASHGVITAQGMFLLAIAQGCVIALLYLLMDQSFVHRMKWGLANSPEVTELTSFLKDLPGEVRAATLPIKLPDLLFVHTSEGDRRKVKYYHRLVLEPDKRVEGYRRFEVDAEELQVFRGPPQEIAGKYDINTVIADTRWMKMKEENEFVRGLRELQPVFANQNYQVYRL